MSLLIGTVAGAFSLDDPAPPLVAGSSVNHIARDGEGFWAVDAEGRVHRGTEVVARAPNGISLNCIQPSSPTIWVGTSEARLFRVDSAALIEDEGFANAPGRSDWYTPWGGPADVRSMAFDAGGNLFVNIHVGGILRYDTEGLTPTLDQDADVHQVMAHPSRPGLILAACALGLAESTNGQDFTFRDEGLHAPYSRAVSIVGETVLLSASTGPRTSRARLYRAPLEGGPFQPCTVGLPEWFTENLDSHCLAAVDGAVYAGLGGTVWRSDDEGGSWSEAAGGLARITCLA